MPAAFFVVRATVTDASKRAAFDTWYETEHVPDAVKAFGVSLALLEPRRSLAAPGDVSVRRRGQARGDAER